MDYIKIIIPKYLAQKDINYILSYYHLGKNKIRSFAKENALLLNDQPSKLDAICNAGDKLSVAINEKIDIFPQEGKLEVVYEDHNFLLVNKPRGMIIHDDGTNNKNTLSNYVAGYFKNHHIRRNVRFANRLDKETEGIVIFSKDPIAQAYIDYQISERKVIKKYYALCHNSFSKKQGIIDLPIASDRHVNNKMIVYKTGKEAKTEYNVIKNGSLSLVDVTLHTGRTHQIRVHLSYMNHPLFGDVIYGDKNESPLCLQAYYIKFYQPFIGKEVEVALPLSKEIEKIKERNQRNGK